MDKGADYATPIRNAYARAQEKNTRSYNNPLGGFTTADVRDKSMRAQNKDFHQNLGIDLANAAQDNANSQFNRQATVAGLTQPQNYMAKSVNKVSDPWGTAMGLVGSGAGVASSAMGGSAK